MIILLSFKRHGKKENNIYSNMYLHAQGWNILKFEKVKHYTKNNHSIA